MRNFKVETTVAKNFNDNTKPGVSYEEGEPITLSRDRYEELFSKGFVNEGKEVKEEKKIEIKEKKEKSEE